MILAAWAGAVVGDNISYGIGKWARRAHGEAALSAREGASQGFDWAEQQLEERGSYIILIARFIPFGRTASRSRPATRRACPGTILPLRRVAGGLWATYATMLGYIGGKQFEEQPWKGVLLGLGIAFGVRVRPSSGVPVDRRRDGRRAPVDADRRPTAGRWPGDRRRGIVGAMNRLAAETSPYLLQHADNPVDWYPWGDEALARAQSEDRPILLSVGYSACHWCHVMAHESFESPRRRPS